MTPGTILVGLILAAVMVWAVHSVWKSHQSGGCTGCPGGCEGCCRCAAHRAADVPQAEDRKCGRD